jgi:hypothetical protein
VIALARLPLARLGRTPRAWVAVAVWCALAIGLALTARHQGATHGADQVLLDGYASFALPLLAYVLVGATFGGRSARASAAPVVAFGAAPADVAIAEVVVAAATCVIGGSLLAALVALIAHGAGDPPALRDALTSAYAGCFGGAAYGSWFALGSGFGRRGGGRTVLLLLDFVVAGDDGVLALITPRGHVRSLLGGEAVLDLPGRASAAMLAVMALALGFAAVARARRV